MYANGIGGHLRCIGELKSRKRKGRPPISQEMQELIRKLSKENRLWTPERLRDSLVLLDYENVPSERTIVKYMYKPKNPEPKSSTWLTFLRNHLDSSWAMDFLTVPTLNFNVLYILIIIDHGRRKIVHFNVTENPSMSWVVQQLREATSFGKQPKYLFRDNDKIFGYGVKEFLDLCGIEELKTAFRSPWQNPIVERMSRFHNLIFQ